MLWAAYTAPARRGNDGQQGVPGGLSGGRGVTHGPLPPGPIRAILRRPPGRHRALPWRPGRGAQRLGDRLVERQPRAGVASYYYCPDCAPPVVHRFGGDRGRRFAVRLLISPEARAAEDAQEPARAAWAMATLATLRSQRQPSSDL